jgi:hypothetical protein
MCGIFSLCIVTVTGAGLGWEGEIPFFGEIEVRVWAQRFCMTWHFLDGDIHM